MNKLRLYSSVLFIPLSQLYVRGELVGGFDIITEMRAAGELGSTIREMLHRMDVA